MKKKTMANKELRQKTSKFPLFPEILITLRKRFTEEMEFKNN